MLGFCKCPDRFIESIGCEGVGAMGPGTLGERFVEAKSRLSAQPQVNFEWSEPYVMAYNSASAGATGLAAMFSMEHCPAGSKASSARASGACKVSFPEVCRFRRPAAECILRHCGFHMFGGLLKVRTRPGHDETELKMMNSAAVMESLAGGGVGPSPDFRRLSCRYCSQRRS